MSPRNRRREQRNSTAPAGAAGDELRIVGGKFRGRRLRYLGDARVRPMKDRVREALFNLVGPAVADARAIDLFGGTGALALEALSRGARRATIIERHVPTAKGIRENIEALEVADRCELVAGSAFVWVKRGLAALIAEAAEHPDAPADRWLVFCSPPWNMFVEETAPLMEMLNVIWLAAPPGSILVVEADERFDPALLPDAETWDVRTYPPAVLALRRKEPDE